MNITHLFIKILLGVLLLTTPQCISLMLVSPFVVKTTSFKNSNIEVDNTITKIISIEKKEETKKWSGIRKNIVDGNNIKVYVNNVEMEHSNSYKTVSYIYGNSRKGTMVSGVVNKKLYVYIRNHPEIEKKNSLIFKVFLILIFMIVIGIIILILRRFS